MIETKKVKPESKRKLKKYLGKLYSEQAEQEGLEEFFALASEQERKRFEKRKGDDK